MIKTRRYRLWITDVVTKETRVEDMDLTDEQAAQLLAAGAEFGPEAMEAMRENKA